MWLCVNGFVGGWNMDWNGGNVVCTNADVSLGNLKKVMIRLIEIKMSWNLIVGDTVESIVGFTGDTRICIY